MQPSDRRESQTVDEAGKQLFVLIPRWNKCLTMWMSCSATSLREERSLHRAPLQSRSTRFGRSTSIAGIMSQGRRELFLLTSRASAGRDDRTKRIVDYHLLPLGYMSQAHRVFQCFHWLPLTILGPDTAVAPSASLKLSWAPPTTPGRQCNVSATGCPS